MNDAPQALAIHGGEPAVTAGPFGWPLPDEAVREALEAAYRDGDWGRYHGARCEALRQRLGAFHSVEHVQLTCSGTLAVEMALRAVGVREGDQVLLAAYDFPGNFRAIEAIGARPVLADIEADSWTIDLAALEAAADGERQEVRAALVSHLHGGLVPMRRLMALAERAGWKVVEDACQASGAVVDGRVAGSWGDAGVLSFGGSKLLTAGRGGAVLTANGGIAQRAKLYTSRGNDAFALSELQAAVLLPQLNTLEVRNQARNAGAERLRRGVSGAPGLTAPARTRQDDTPAYYKLAWRAQQERLRSTTETICAALQAEGAPLDTGFRGFAKRSDRRCRKLTPIPNAENAASTTMVLHHPALLAPPHAIDQIAVAMEKVLAYFSSERA